MKSKTARSATAANVAPVAAVTRHTAYDASWSKANACSVTDQASSLSANNPPTQQVELINPQALA